MPDFGVVILGGFGVLVLGLIRRESRTVDGWQLMKLNRDRDRMIT